MQLLGLHAAKAADLAQIIAAQVDEHIVLGQFFLIAEQFLLQPQVFFLAASSAPCPSQRKGAQYTVIQTDQRFRGSAGDLDVTKTYKEKGSVCAAHDTY